MFEPNYFVGLHSYRAGDEGPLESLVIQTLPRAMLTSSSSSPTLAEGLVVMMGSQRGGLRTGIACWPN